MAPLLRSRCTVNAVVISVIVCAHNEGKFIGAWMDDYGWMYGRCRLADARPETIFTGVLGGKAVADVFASADLFLCPSRTDTSGNVVLEAQASGLPVIISDQGGLREQVVSDITGRICAGADPSRWAKVAHELLHNRGELTAMGKADRRVVTSRS
jgi:glycosyltransferase involved in cell wall biosynthesis